MPMVNNTAAFTNLEFMKVTSAEILRKLGEQNEDTGTYSPHASIAFRDRHKHMQVLSRELALPRRQCCSNPCQLSQFRTQAQCNVGCAEWSLRFIAQGHFRKSNEYERRRLKIFTTSFLKLLSLPYQHNPGSDCETRADIPEDGKCD